MRCSHLAICFVLVAAAAAALSTRLCTRDFQFCGAKERVENMDIELPNAPNAPNIDLDCLGKCAKECWPIGTMDLWEEFWVVFGALQFMGIPFAVGFRWPAYLQIAMTLFQFHFQWIAIGRICASVDGAFIPGCRWLCSWRLHLQLLLIAIFLIRWIA